MGNKPLHILPIRLQPRASKNEICGWQEGRLKIRLNAPPVEGAANDALLKFTAQLLGIRRAQVKLESGEKSRSKNLAIYAGSEKLKQLFEERNGFDAAD